MMASDDVIALQPLQQLSVQMHAILHRVDEDTKSNIPVLTEREWHQRFVTHEMAHLARLDKKNHNESALDSERTLTYWMAGLYQIPRHQQENLVDYSMRVAEGSGLYHGKFQEFKQGSVKQAKSITASENQALTKGALNDIKQFIETSRWQVGKWGSCSKIEVNGEMKPIPHHLHAIYKKCLEVEKGGDPVVCLQEIHEIAEKALQPKSKAFERFRARYQSTIDVYTVIERDTKNLLNPP